MAPNKAPRIKERNVHPPFIGLAFFLLVSFCLIFGQTDPLFPQSAAGDTATAKRDTIATVADAPSPITKFFTIVCEQREGPTAQDIENLIAWLEKNFVSGERVRVIGQSFWPDDPRDRNYAEVLRKLSVEDAIDQAGFPVSDDGRFEEIPGKDGGVRVELVPADDVRLTVNELVGAVNKLGFGQDSTISKRAESELAKAETARKEMEESRGRMAEMEAETARRLEKAMRQAEADSVARAKVAQNKSADTTHADNGSGQKTDESRKWCIVLSGTALNDDGFDGFPTIGYARDLGNGFWIGAGIGPSTANADKFLNAAGFAQLELLPKKQLTPILEALVGSEFYQSRTNEFHRFYVGGGVGAKYKDTVSLSINFGSLSKDSEKNSQTKIFLNLKLFF